MRGIILSAGLGTRLKPLTDNIPKCMVEVGGKTMLEHAADYLNSFDIKQIIVNLHYLPEKVYQRFGNRFLYFYEPTLLGEMGTIHALKDWIDGATAVINADTLTNLDLFELSCRYDSNMVRSYQGDTYTGQTVVRPSYFYNPREIKIQTDAWWIDMGTPEGLKIANEKLNNLSKLRGKRQKKCSW